jgi:hypothetical protein
MLKPNACAKRIDIQINATLITDHAPGEQRSQDHRQRTEQSK